MTSKPISKKKSGKAPSEKPPKAGAGDFYQTWRGRVRDWAGDRELTDKLLGVGLAVPDLIHLLTRLMADSRVSLADKARMGFAVLYLASPIDLLPEVIFGPAGLLDDVAVVAWALRGLLREEHWGLIEEHWAGDRQVLSLLSRAVQVMGSNVGSGKWRRFREIFTQLSDAVPPEPLPRPKGGPGGRDPGPGDGCE